MAETDIKLKRLLSGELPLEKVGPHLRHACRRALHSGDMERMKLTAKVVIGDLAGRGELLGVSVNYGLGDTPGGGPFCMVKGSRRLIDLSFLNGEEIHFPVPATGLPEAPAASEGVDPVPPIHQPNLEAISGIIGAMEHAQDLEIGDPRSGDKAVILGSILRLLSRYMPNYPMFIMLHGSEPVPEEQNQLFTVGMDEASVGWLSVRTTGHSVWIPNPEELPRHINSIAGERDPAAQDFGDRVFGSAVAVPLWEPVENGQPSHSATESGLLFLVADENFGRDPLLRLAERISRFVTRRWRHQREVNQRIHVDSLTKVYNRAYYLSQIPLELERARRSEVPLTIVFADLDKFKTVNDTYGHPAGDAVLSMVARRLQEELRRIDHICRMGGEEFALILPDTSQEAAQEVMGRLLESKFSTAVLFKGETVEITVTFSYGAVTFPAGGSDPDQLYRKADDMCLLSKELGRNRCHFWAKDENHLQLLPPDTLD
jgi:diguanylate cyclase (GGDEF)-like protein